MIMNQGPFEEFISALSYTVGGKDVVQVQMYRQFFDRAVDLLKENSFEQERFERAIRASEIHHRERTRAYFSISPTAWDEWQSEDNANRKEIQGRL